MRNKRVTYIKRKNRWFKRILILFILAVLGIIIFLFSFKIKNVIVVGESKYSEEEIKDFVIRDNLDHNSLYLFLKYKYKEQEQIPFIQHISVKMMDKNTVKLHVYNKAVTGCIEYMGEYLYFDKDGIIVESTTELEEGIPIIKGLSFNRLALNEQIKVQKQELFNTILNLSQLIKQNELQVDVIKFDSQDAVTLYCKDIKVLLGIEEFYDKPLAQLKNILTECEGKVSKIDMRDYDVDKPVIGTKKES